MNGKERNEHDARCLHCGAEAEWSYLDPEKSRIEVMCPDCGRYEVSKEEFDQAEAEYADLNQIEPR